MPNECLSGQVRCWKRRHRYDAVEQRLTFIGCTLRSASVWWAFTLTVYLHTAGFEATPTHTPVTEEQEQVSNLPSRDPTREGWGPNSPPGGLAPEPGSWALPGKWRHQEGRSGGRGPSVTWTKVER